MLEQTEGISKKFERNSNRLEKLEKDQDLMKLILEARTALDEIS